MQLQCDHFLCLFVCVSDFSETFVQYCLSLLYFVCDSFQFSSFFARKIEQNVIFLALELHTRKRMLFEQSCKRTYTQSTHPTKTDDNNNNEDEQIWHEKEWEKKTIPLSLNWKQHKLCKRMKSASFVHQKHNKVYAYLCILQNGSSSSFQP